MAKSEAIYHGDPRNHHSDIVKLKARVEELEADVERPEPLTEEWPDLSVNFYRCPNTGDLVYRWADERMVLVPSDELADLRASRARVKELEERIIYCSGSCYV